MVANTRAEFVPTVRRCNSEGAYGFVEPAGPSAQAGTPRRAALLIGEDRTGASHRERQHHAYGNGENSLHRASPWLILSFPRLAAYVRDEDRANGDSGRPRIHVLRLSSDLSRRDSDCVVDRRVGGVRCWQLVVDHDAVVHNTLRGADECGDGLHAAGRRLRGGRRRVFSKIPVAVLSRVLRCSTAADLCRRRRGAV